MYKVDELKQQMHLAILTTLPEIVANAVKPIENIDGIKILQGYGSVGGTDAMGHAGANNGASQGGLAEQVTTAALNYRANGPVVDALLQEVGLVEGEGKGLADLVKGNSPSLFQPAQATTTTVAMSPTTQKASVADKGFDAGTNNAGQ